MTKNYDWLVHVVVSDDGVKPRVGDQYVVGEVHEMGSGFERTASFTLVKPEPFKATAASDLDHCPVCGTSGHMVYSDPARVGTGHFEPDPFFRISHTRLEVYKKALAAVSQLVYDHARPGPEFKCIYCGAHESQTHDRDCPVRAIADFRETLTAR